MKRLFTLGVMVLLATGCGSTGTDSSGTGDDDDDGGSAGPVTCADISVTAPVTCADVGGKATLGVTTGTTAGTVAAGDDPRLAAIDPNKGKYIASFTPAVGTEAIGGMIIKNPATGKIGIKAADELCKAKNTAFPNAHMCTNEEIVDNVRKGFIVAGATGLALSTHQDPGTGSGTRDSYKASCGGLTYNTADLFYRGTRWTVAASDPKNESPGNDNLDAVAVNFEGNVACNTTGIPIACCQ